jgi:imidazolonepropionase-like amidohydrolase
MGNAAIMREALMEAKEYLEEKEAASDTSEQPKYDKNCEALIPVLEGEIPLLIHCHRADDISTAVRIADEFDVPYVLEHVTEANHVLDLLEDSQTHLAIGPTMHYGSKVENRERDFRTPVQVSRRAIDFCLITDHPVLHGKYLPLSAGLAVTWGMDYDTALRAITLSAAEHAGIEDRVGSIEPGKDADLVIWSGDPLDYMSFADYTIIDGEVVYRREVQ